MIWFFGALAFLGGVLNTIQSGSNAVLSKSLGQPITAALVVTLVNGALYLLIGAVHGGLGMPKVSALHTVPWWGWLGGAFGGAYVLASIFFAETLGAGVFIGLTVTAGIVTSLVMDHWGLVGFKEHALNWPRALGATLMIGGVILVALN